MILIFISRNKHIMIDLGTGNNNKINWAMEDKQVVFSITNILFRILKLDPENNI